MFWGEGGEERVTNDDDEATQLRMRKVVVHLRINQSCQDLVQRMKLMHRHMLVPSRVARSRWMRWLIWRDALFFLSHPAAHLATLL